MWFAVTYATQWCYDNHHTWRRRRQFAVLGCSGVVYCFVLFCFVGFEDFFLKKKEGIRENDFILLCLKSNVILGKDQIVPLNWLPPSWLHIVLKWNIWHILQLGCYFVSLDKVIQNSLKNKLNGRGMCWFFFFSPIDIWSFLSKLMRSFIWRRKALIQALRFPYLPVNWC